MPEAMRNSFFPNKPCKERGETILYKHRIVAFSFSNLPSAAKKNGYQMVSVLFWSC